jgi:phosphoribosylformylglycinamidine synthase
VDLAGEQRLAVLLAAAAANGLISGAHDLSDGGLAQALVEACLVGGRGATVTLPPALDPFVTLFAESAGRMLVTIAADRVAELAAAAAEAGVPVRMIGTTGGPDLDVAGVPALPLEELRTAWEGTLPALFG